jgi:hypothetical protein
MITASKLELVERCPGSITLPWTDEPNAYSDAGNERHAADEHAIGSGDVPDVYRERWPEVTQWFAEVSYACDVSDGTSRYLGTGLHRAYGQLAPFEIAGTLDVEGRGPGLLVVIDKKSFEAVTPAAANPQLRFCALAAARAWPAEHIEVAINHELTGLDVASVDPVFDLDVIQHDVRQLLIRSAGVRAAARAGHPVEFQTGRWCRWCPAFHSCPKQAELRQLASNPDDPNLALKLVLDEESAPDVYALYRRISILQKRIAQSLHAYAARRPIPLGGGRFFGPHEKQGNERLDGDVVWSVVKELYPEAADAAVIRSATKKRLEEALKGRRGAVRKVLDLVRERGGTSRSAGSAIEEYTAGPKLVTSGEDESTPTADSPF